MSGHVRGHLVDLGRVVPADLFDGRQDNHERAPSAEHLRFVARSGVALPYRRHPVPAVPLDPVELEGGHEERIAYAVPPPVGGAGGDDDHLVLSDCDGDVFWNGVVAMDDRVQDGLPDCGAGKPVHRALRTVDDRFDVVGVHYLLCVVQNRQDGSGDPRRRPVRPGHGDAVGALVREQEGQHRVGAVVPVDSGYLIQSMEWDHVAEDVESESSYLGGGPFVLVAHDTL